MNQVIEIREQGDLEQGDRVQGDLDKVTEQGDEIREQGDLEKVYLIRNKVT